MGNICRSPAGENVFRHLVKEAGLAEQIHCDSAGTIGFHTGKAPDARMSKTIRNRGYQVTGTSRQFGFRDFEIFDLILTMDDENYEVNRAIWTRCYSNYSGSKSWRVR